MFSSSAHLRPSFPGQDERMLSAHARTIRTLGLALLGIVVVGLLVLGARGASRETFGRSSSPPSLARPFLHPLKSRPPMRQRLTLAA